MAKIPLHIYESLKAAKAANRYANYISNNACKLGGTKQFKVENSGITVELKCTQKGGMWSGSYCYILA